MIDHDGDENYEPFVIPLDGGFPEPLAEESFRGRRSSLLDVDPETATAYFNAQSREEAMEFALRVDLESGQVEEVGRSMYGAYVGAWTPDHSRVFLVDGYSAGDVVLYELAADGSRDVLLGTPIDEREAGRDYPLTGLSYDARDGERERNPARLDACSTTPAARAISTWKRAKSSRSRSPGSSTRAQDELEGMDHLEGVRYELRYNIDGCSWAYEATFDEGAKALTVERVLVGEGDLSGGMIHGLHYDKGSGGFALSYCTATDPTQLYLLEPDAGSTPARRTRERALGLAPELLSAGEDASFESLRRAAGLRAALSPVARARLRGPAPARLLRARRAAEPGAPELRVVLDAAHPDSHARGLRGLRPERARLARATGSST